MSDVAYATTFRLSYADCDPAGIIYYASWFIAMERASTQWFFDGGIRFDTMSDEFGGAVVTRSTSCEYLAPARAYDLVELEVRVADVGCSSYTLAYTMTRADDGVRLASSTLTGVFVGADGRSAPLPERLRTMFGHGGPEALEA